jgi:hypothetical protein
MMLPENRAEAQRWLDGYRGPSTTQRTYGWGEYPGGMRPPGLPVGSATGVNANGAPNGVGQDRVENARQAMYGQATGRLNDLKGDPLDELISSQLSEVIGGKSSPYDDRTISALMTQATDEGADAEGAAWQDLIDQHVAAGGNPNDPSLLAERRAMLSNRQKGNQSAMNSIRQNANVANFQARQGASAQGAAFNSARNNAITGQSNYLGNLYSRETASTEGGGGGYALPSYSTYRQQAPTWNPAPYQPNYWQPQAQNPVWGQGGGLATGAAATHQPVYGGNTTNRGSDGYQGSYNPPIRGGQGYSEPAGPPAPTRTTNPVVNYGPAFPVGAPLTSQPGSYSFKLTGY